MGENADWFTRHRDAFLDDVKDAWKLFEKNISHDYKHEKRSGTYNIAPSASIKL